MARCRIFLLLFAMAAGVISAEWDEFIVETAHPEEARTIIQNYGYANRGRRPVYSEHNIYIVERGSEEIARAKAKGSNTTQIMYGVVDEITRNDRRKQYSFDEEAFNRAFPKSKRPMHYYEPY